MIQNEQGDHSRQAGGLSFETSDNLGFQGFGLVE
jgi:hypothetical protein